MRAQLNPVAQRAQAAATPANQRILTQLLNSMEAMMALSAQGFVLCQVKIGGVKPLVQIESNPRLAKMVAENNAAYYKRTESQLVGAFDLCDCQIVWTEVLQ